MRYAPFCDANGKMVGDGTVFKIDDSSCIVVTALDTDLDHFKGVVGDLDVEIAAATIETPQVGINGPARARVAAVAVRCRRLGASLLPLLARAGGGRRRPLLGLSNRLFRRARLRALLRAGRCRAALGCRGRRRRTPLRARRGRDDSDRVGVDLHRVRLLPRRDEPVRHVARQADPLRRARLLRQGGACRRGRQPTAAARHPRARRR